MGASISFDSKYRLVLDTEVECISVNTPSLNKTSTTDSSRKSKKDVRHCEHDDHRSDDGSGSESGSESGSGSESDTENKIYTVKITPEIVSYIRSYLRKNEFLDEFDLITEIDLDDYDHAPGSALVFNSDSIVYITNNQTIEAVGEWEYLPPEDEVKVKPTTKSKLSSKSKSKSNNRHNDSHSESDGEMDDDSHANGTTSRNKYKTEEDDLPVSEIENILKHKFDEYNKGHEFIIHESKNSLLCLKINSVEIVKA